MEQDLVWMHGNINNGKLTYGCMKLEERNLTQMNVSKEWQQQRDNQRAIRAREFVIITIVDHP